MTGDRRVGRGDRRRWAARALLASVLAVAACSDGDEVETGSEQVGFPEASSECEAAVAEIRDGWQQTIDEHRDRDVEELVAAERIYNFTEVPIGGQGCEPGEATTLATDRAGGLVAETPAAALAKGIILADVGEMHYFGPGLDPEAPIATGVDPSPPDLQQLRGERPGEGAACAAHAGYAMTVVQATIDATASFGRDLVFEPQRFMEPEDAPLISEAQGLLDDAVDGAAAVCSPQELALEMARRWQDLHATGLAANLWLGGMADDHYDDFNEAFADG